VRFCQGGHGGNPDAGRAVEHRTRQHGCSLLLGCASHVCGQLSDFRRIALHFAPSIPHGGGKYLGMRASGVPR
jgi:hypothetical protein